MSPSRGRVAKNEDSTRLSPMWSKETLLDPDDREKYGMTEATIQKSVTTDKAISIAACFLTDYEAGRSPTLSSDFHNISDFQLRVYRFQHSFCWRWLGLYPAMFFIFMANFPSQIWTAALHVEAVLIFLVDMNIRRHFCTKEWCLHDDSQKELHFHKAALVFLVVHGIQSCLWFFWYHAEASFATLVVSLFKPLLFFYISPRARAALEALIRIGRTLARVVAIELFLILTFAAVACRLYYNEDGFQSLAMSWLSLFQLSTAVVNPSLWMPMYSKAPVNALFFVFFMVVCVFYLHSLTLSVVFQVFIQAATEVHNRSVLDKEKSLLCAFSALSSNQLAMQPIGQVHELLIRRTLEQVRPHYGPMKIDILMELVNPAKKQSFHYPAFRMAIRDALDASVRTSTKVGSFGQIVEILAVLVVCANFIFVSLLTSSRFQAGWLLDSVLAIGSLITLFGIVELGIRVNIWTATYHMTKLNLIFDGFAVIGALISCYGICISMAGNQGALDYLLTGRAIDMVRTMRFFPMFRDVVERSIDVLPALAGPVFLVFTTIHVFVIIGIGLWGGKIDVEDLTNNNQNLQPLYCLNNFNSYTEGLVTIFNVLAINDWHEIARVFLSASQHSHPVIVYAYFVVVVLVAVCIMLNVITAFFVEAFTARLSKDDMEKDGVIRFQKAQAEFNVSTRRDNFSSDHPSQESIDRSLMEKEESPVASHHVCTQSDQVEGIQFNVFERHGFDRIIQAVTQSTSEKEKIAQCLCETLEALTSMFYEMRSLEFLVTCRPNLQSSDFQSVGFQQRVAEFLDEYSLQSLIDELTTHCPMSSDLFMRRVKHIVHPRVPTIILDLTVIPVPHVTDLWLITAQRRQIGGIY